MAKKSRYRQTRPRSIAMLTVECFAAPALFKPWEKMTAGQQNEFAANGPIPCEGGGLPGEWCAGCRFGKISEPELLESQ